MDLQAMDREAKKNLHTEYPLLPKMNPIPKRSLKEVLTEASGLGVGVFSPVFNGSASREQRGGGGRIVSGFGSERIDDVAGDVQRRIEEGARRGTERRNAGERGRMTGFDGQDLDRSAGGAWHAGRR